MSIKPFDCSATQTLNESCIFSVVYPSGWHARVKDLRLLRGGDSNM